jgi:hypothetical protein
MAARTADVLRGWALIALAFAAVSARADQTIHVEYTEVPYQRPWAFLGLAFEGIGKTQLTHGTGAAVDGKPLWLGLHMMSARDSNIQFEIGLGVGKLDASALNLEGADSLFMFELTLGGRFFPRKPLLALGSLVIRPTLSAHGGFNTVGGGANGVAVLTAGLVFGFTDDPNGLTAEFVYRPLGGEASFYPPGLTETEDKFKYEANWALRFGFLFGPG